MNMNNLRPEDFEKMTGSIPLHEYERIIKETDRFSDYDINPIILGLYGEVGSITNSK